MSSLWGGGGSSSSASSGSGAAAAGAGGRGSGGGDEEAGEASSFLPSFVRGAMGRPAAPAPSEWACGLTYGQRLQIGLLVLVAAGFLFFAAVFMFLPLVVLMPSKFATAFTFASLLTMAGFALLRGPRTFLLGLADRDRLAFTGAYVASLALTLYATFVAASYVVIMIAIVAQVAALGWYASTFVPGGTTGMGFMSRMVLSSAASSARGVAGMVVGR